MWRRVDIVFTDVSEKRIASIFMVGEYPRPRNQREQVLTDSSLANFLLLSSTLKMEAILSSEM
jgi:hypothetical protein